jgi:tetratricopeptide (TPR) repeat protein
MVYDGRNRAVSGVEFYRRGKRIAVSDVHGRFFLPIRFGDHTIVTHRDGYESESIRFTYHSHPQALHVRITSIDEILETTERAVHLRKWDEAEHLLDRAYDIDADSPSALFLDAVFLYRSDRPTEAIDRLQRLITSGYDDAYVYVFLSDVYEIALDDRELALDHALEAYSRIGSDELGERVRRLQSDR